jgi:hypothetical protein
MSMKIFEKRASARAQKERSSMFWFLAELPAAPALCHNKPFEAPRPTSISSEPSLKGVFHTYFIFVVGLYASPFSIPGALLSGCP